MCNSKSITMALPEPKPAVPAPMHVAVIGAGLSGLTAARPLADHGHRVQVFEKSRGAGGRMATRRNDPYRFDHGAQYFTVRDRRFRKMVDSWVQSDLVRQWKGRIRVIRSGELQKETGTHRRYVAVPGMNALARHLAHRLEIGFNVRVQEIRKSRQALVLLDENGGILGSFDAVIVSAPPAQSARLLQGLTSLTDTLDKVQMDPCWAVMLAFKKPLELAFDGAFVHDSDLVWVARNSSKPGRGKEECWILHAGAEWSRNHLEVDSKAVIQHLTASFFADTGIARIEPVLTAAHRWRYARARNPLAEGCLWDRQVKIGVCGDWCCNSRIEGAFLSGAAMAGRVRGAAGTGNK